MRVRLVFVSCVLMHALSSFLHPWEPPAIVKAAKEPLRSFLTDREFARQRIQVCVAIIEIGHEQ